MYKRLDYVIAKLDRHICLNDNMKSNHDTRYGASVLFCFRFLSVLKQRRYWTQPQRIDCLNKFKR